MRLDTGGGGGDWRSQDSREKGDQFGFVATQSGRIEIRGDRASSCVLEIKNASVPHARLSATLKRPTTLAFYRSVAKADQMAFSWVWLYTYTHHIGWLQLIQVP